MSAIELGEPAGDEMPPPQAVVAHRPQSLLLNFFGALVLDAGLPPLPSATLLVLLADLGIA